MDYGASTYECALKVVVIDNLVYWGVSMPNQVDTNASETGSAEPQNLASNDQGWCKECQQSNLLPAQEIIFINFIM